MLKLQQTTTVAAVFEGSSTTQVSVISDKRTDLAIETVGEAD